MPAYYDEQPKSWYCKFYYTDYTGTKKQKKKRGFKLQREAKEWERTFLERLQGTPDMTFQTLYDLYIEDSTWQNVQIDSGMPTYGICIKNLCHYELCRNVLQPAIQPMP